MRRRISEKQLREIVAHNLVTGRKKAKLTQAALAELSQVHLLTISALENARFNATMELLLRLTNALDLNPGDLFKTR